VSVLNIVRYKLYAHDDIENFRASLKSAQGRLFISYGVKWNHVCRETLWHFAGKGRLHTSVYTECTICSPIKSDNSPYSSPYRTSSCLSKRMLRVYIIDWHTFCARDGNLSSCGMLTSVVCPLDHTLCARNIGRQSDLIPEDFFLLGLQGNVERYVPGARYIQREPATGEYRSHHQKVWRGFRLRHVN